MKFAPERLWRSWKPLRSFLIAGSLGPLYNDAAKRRMLKPEAIWEVKTGLSLSAADIYQASVDRSAWYQALQQLFARYDYLLLPSAQVFPFNVEINWPTEVTGKAMDTYHRWMEVVVTASLAGVPVISVPVGFNQEGLPMGMQIIGKPKADLAVLQLDYEQATGWVQKRKPALISMEADKK